MHLCQAAAVRGAKLISGAAKKTEKEQKQKEEKKGKEAGVLEMSRAELEAIHPDELMQLAAGALANKYRWP